MRDITSTRPSVKQLDVVTGFKGRWNPFVVVVVVVIVVVVVVVVLAFEAGNGKKNTQCNFEEIQLCESPQFGPNCCGGLILCSSDMFCQK